MTKRFQIPAKSVSGPMLTASRPSPTSKSSASPDMSSLTRLEDMTKNLSRQPTGVVILIILVLLAGCRSESGNPAKALAQDAATSDIDAEIARASNFQQP